MACSYRSAFALLLLISIISLVGEGFYKNFGSITVTKQQEPVESDKNGAKQVKERLEKKLDTPAERILRALHRNMQTKSDPSDDNVSIGSRNNKEEYLTAEELASRMQDVINVLLGRDFQYEKLKLKISQDKRTWVNNALMEKLQKASDAAERGLATNCTIKVIQYCGHFCENVKGIPISSWRKYPYAFTTCEIFFMESIELKNFLISDLVIFLPGIHDWDTLALSRPPGQLWVYHSKESPRHWKYFTPPPELGNPFNLSLTYMTNSDIPHPYFFYQPNATDDNLPVIKNKTHLASWASSNCNKTSWNRKGFVELLQEHIPIHTYGLCGSLVCERADPACKDLTSHFKFNLAFENSQCPEYISEKFWWNALTHGTVPIVFGAPKADYERLAPPNSFIHLDDFSSIEEFAQYIKEVDRNETRYKEFFKWREHGTVKRGSSMISSRRLRPPHIYFILKVMIDKSYNPDSYPWQRNHPVFYDWFNGMCPISKTALGEDITFKPIEEGERDLHDLLHNITIASTFS